MKIKTNSLIICGIIGIILLFLISLWIPAFQIIAKAGALFIYAFVNYVQIKEMKKKGQPVDKAILFTVAVLVIVGYLLLLFTV